MINIEKSIKRKEYRFIMQVLVIALIMSIIGFVIAILIVSDHDNLRHEAKYCILYTLLISIPLWIGNSYIGNNLNWICTWKGTPRKRLIVSLLATFFYTIFVSIAVHFFWMEVILQQDFALLDLNTIIHILVILIITYIVSSYVYSRKFFRSWQEAIIEQEALKRDVLTMEYKALKNQVNPHFLFNTLNVLTSIVADNDKATTFIKKLSDVYRYVLEQKDKQVVGLSTELQFVKDYIYLQKIRYEIGLNIHINLTDISKMIVPLSLQMLVENAVKHNIVSDEQPLQVEIYSENADYVVVKNNLQKKSNIIKTEKIGLENIKSRYKFLTNKPFIVEQTTTDFTVKLPVIEYES